MIISRIGEKAFDQIQHRFMKKTVNRRGIEEIFLFWRRASVKNLQSTSHLTVYDCKAFLLRAGTK